MPRLSCVHCRWKSEPYERLSKTVKEQAIAHTKQEHNIFYKFWSIEGRVIEKCFKVDG